MTTDRVNLGRCRVFGVLSNPVHLRAIGMLERGCSTTASAIPSTHSAKPCYSCLFLHTPPLPPARRSLTPTPPPSDWRTHLGNGGPLPRRRRHHHQERVAVHKVPRGLLPGARCRRRRRHRRAQGLGGWRPTCRGSWRRRSCWGNSSDALTSASPAATTGWYWLVLFEVVHVCVCMCERERSVCVGGAGRRVLLLLVFDLFIFCCCCCCCRLHLLATWTLSSSQKYSYVFPCRVLCRIDAVVDLCT